MDCLNCKGKTKVDDSIRYAGSVYRRRKCLACKFSFWTEEREVVNRKIVAEAYKYKSLRGKRSS